MSRESLVFVLGFIIFLMPFLGIPRDSKEYFYGGAGIFLMLIGFALRRSAFFRSITEEGGDRASSAFAESRGDTTHASRTESDTSV